MPTGFGRVAATVADDGEDPPAGDGRRGAGSCAPFGGLSFRRAMPETLGGDRPVLVAHKADYGWNVRYIVGEQPPRQAQVRETTGACRGTSCL